MAQELLFIWDHLICYSCKIHQFGYVTHANMKGFSYLKIYESNM
jgi:hypothetical protein